jgi:hypothetical protein
VPHELAGRYGWIGGESCQDIPRTGWDGFGVPGNRGLQLPGRRLPNHALVELMRRSRLGERVPSESFFMRKTVPVS